MEKSLKSLKMLFYANTMGNSCAPYREKNIEFLRVVKETKTAI